MVVKNNGTFKQIGGEKMISIVKNRVMVQRAIWFFKGHTIKLLFKITVRIACMSTL